MLNADGVAVGSAGMPSLVFFTYHLRNLPVGGANHIMCRNLRVAILEPTDAACVRAFSIMDYNSIYFLGARFPITFWSRVPNGRRIVGTAENAQFGSGEHIVMLSENG